ncbi:MAG: hypothetical protein GY811_15850 [Myxococcales bacterium]|nr:hypothetical protein [Myxococcales bacterium]
MATGFPLHSLPQGRAHHRLQRLVTLGKTLRITARNCLTVAIENEQASIASQGNTLDRVCDEAQIDPSHQDADSLTGTTPRLSHNGYVRLALVVDDVADETSKAVGSQCRVCF